MSARDGGNLLAGLPAGLVPEELVTVLTTRDGVRIERIVSTGQASPPGFWYDQDEHEFVLVLDGAAGLRFEDEDAARRLTAGDWAMIPAHRRHRVDWTCPDAATVWLAVFWRT